MKDARLVIFAILFIVVSIVSLSNGLRPAEFSSLEEQVDYCHWKYEQYCESWEEGGFRPGGAPMGGFRGYAPECYSNGLELNDGLEICLAYEESY